MSWFMNMLGVLVDPELRSLFTNGGPDAPPDGVIYERQLGRTKWRVRPVLPLGVYEHQFTKLQKLPHINDI